MPINQSLCKNRRTLLPMTKARKKAFVPTPYVFFGCFLFSVIFPNYPQPANLVPKRRGAERCLNEAGCERSLS